MDPPPLEPGTVLAGKYRLGQRLGEGGMGTVYLAEHLVLKANVAVKVIDKEVIDGGVTLARFTREAQAAASLRSPHVVQILDYGTEGDRPFMVMELLEGETLAQRLERVGRLTPGETYRVISHVARAVAKAHEAGIVHRDLKPDNVFLVHNEGDEIAKVLDFGVAKVDTTSLGGHSHTRTGSLLGTPYYMSPEQAQGNKEIDHRSDLWALGVIAFECLLGHRPFSSDGLGDLVIQICIRDIPVPSALGQVPEGFDAWFAQAVARDPENRFQSARELTEALGAALGVQRELGSIPEPAWSLPGGALPRPRLASQAASPDGVRTRADVARPLEETMSDVEVPRPSRWEVVPRSPGYEEPQRPRPTFVTEPPPPASGFWSVVLVALLALVLGGGGVFLLREAGVTIPGVEPRSAASPAPRPAASEEIQPEAEEPADGAAPATKKPARAPSAAGSTSKVDASVTPSAEEPSAALTEAEVLDAIDAAAAARAAAEGKPIEGKPAETKPVEGKPETKSEPRPEGVSEAAPSGPKPELPEGLKPGPTPPPPIAP